MTGTPNQPRVCFIVESGTDVRLVEGLAERVALQVLARDIPGGRPVSQPTAHPISIVSSGRLTFACQAFATILRSSIDVVLVQGHGVAALAANVAARIRGIPCWMLICSPAAEYYEARRGGGSRFSAATLAVIHLLGRLNGSVGQGYIVLSQHLRDVVRRYDARHPVHIIPVYGVDLAHFTATADRAHAREMRGLPSTGTFIFNSSRVAPEKDVLTLIDAFTLLVAEGRDVYLLHRSGGFREFLEHARRAGVSHRVIATDAADPRRELPLDYVSADVCVQASRAEGLGFSVLEALACGTPVVVSAVGGLLETVSDGVTGWTVPPGNAPALASALRDALDHPEEARRRAAAGREIVQSRFERNAAFDALAACLGTKPSPLTRPPDTRIPGQRTPDHRTPEPSPAIEQGHYYRKQLGCDSSVIAWSHRARFAVGLGLIGAAPRRLLDYGCGDGTFLAMAADRIGTGCGADLDAAQTEDARRRLASFRNLRFCTIGELSAPTHASAYDVVTCMETLEHCTEDIVHLVLRDLSRLVAADGRVVISVPIETGPTFLLKLLVRKAAAWRGLSDYRYYESYPIRDALRMILAGKRGPIARPVYGGPASPYHSHYGFNWKALRENVREHLAIEATHFSPLGFSRGLASSQAWFVCRPVRSK
jgi:glycosyltransferase involved in cell wall biosynthesis/SAM-dependent methyltransferase